VKSAAKEKREAKSAAKEIEREAKKEKDKEERKEREARSPAVEEARKERLAKKKETGREVASVVCLSVEEIHMEAGYVYAHDDRTAQHRTKEIIEHVDNMRIARSFLLAVSYLSNEEQETEAKRLLAIAPKNRTDNELKELEKLIETGKNSNKRKRYEKEEERRLLKKR
jgi:hypothetical protein